MTSSESRAWAELLLPVVIGLAIAGTGGWTAERWNTAIALIGLSTAVRLGYVKPELLLPLVIGLVFAGTGGWTSERWTTAFALMGLGPAVRLGYVKGYATYNPDLRPPATTDQPNTNQEALS